MRVTYLICGLDGSQHIETREIPEETITGAQLREEAYNSEKLIEWSGESLTVTEAARLWQYYAAEGDTGKTALLTDLIAAAKAEIRARYPDAA